MQVGSWRSGIASKNAAIQISALQRAYERRFACGLVPPLFHFGDDWRKSVYHLVTYAAADRDPCTSDWAALCDRWLLDGAFVPTEALGEYKDYQFHLPVVDPDKKRSPSFLFFARGSIDNKDVQGHVSTASYIRKRGTFAAGVASHTNRRWSVGTRGNRASRAFA